jgi:fructose-1,6-bisphosphatase/inositol monophosphatase family enzyme
MTLSNPSEFVTGMAEIAREAGALLMGYFQQHVKVEYKGDADLVTIADRTSEILIRERIKARWPAHDILGEEQGLVDTGSDYRWFVDPLDGTTNFAHGFPVFCVSLGLQHKDRLIAGVVYDPTRDELFAAEQGSGAWLTQQRNQASKMQVSKSRTCLRVWWPPAFPATSGTRTRIFTSIIRLRCAPTVYGVQVPRLSTYAVWPAAASMASGSSISIPGTPPRVY